ncbi:Maf family protein [Candidatus Marithrix sp. Canyon 246]|uniref:Maf family protein n=1 Tax=Candidatus Marithrix sp. Canyon 246 TaxID=1827136 RepID=UPI000849F373|nr:Maf family nucleotide pyrophosphatase [Candidatus Marithrix sp. Canyon 246]
MSKTLVLASTSPFRKEILSRLHIAFETVAPLVDETPLENESPTQLVTRLSILKAKSAKLERALVIGSDQVAVVDNNTILGKPGNHEQAVKQLNQVSGKQVDFLTGLSVINTETDKIQTDVVHFAVKFRQLTSTQIENYLKIDQPYNCAGSFKSEGLGIALLDRMIGSDPTAIIGLPLIRLVRMLEAEGFSII